jgi:hypothetical protein
MPRNWKKCLDLKCSKFEKSSDFKKCSNLKKTHFKNVHKLDFFKFWKSLVLKNIQISKLFILKPFKLKSSKLGKKN